MTLATPQRPDASPLDGEPTAAERDQPLTDRLEKGVTALIVFASALFVFWQLQPNLIFTDSTPTGGDMGAHVWGPAFLRDELLPNLRLTGWTPDWYSGFPAFHFYMVIPALAIVILDVGLHPLVAIPVVLGLAAGALYTRFNGQVVTSRRLSLALVVLAPLLISLPYNIAFKLVAVSGVVMFPVAAWALGHFGGLRFPGPAVLSLSSLAFAFDRSFNIYGGNIASTLAGEFAASISLSLSLVALGFVIRGTRTGQDRGKAAVFIALTALCHLLPAFFLLAAVSITVATRMLQRRFAAMPWILISGGLSVLVSAFWVLPFFLRTAYLNDMGWERIEILHSPLVTRSNLNPANVLSDYPPLPVLLVLAAVGLILSIIQRVELGWLLGLTGALMAAGFVWFPDGRLWNARILPFYYLCVALLAGVGVYLTIVSLSKAPAAIRVGLGASSAIMLLPTETRNAVVWPEPGGEIAPIIASFGDFTSVMSDYIPGAAAYSVRVLAIFMLIAVLGTELPRQLGRMIGNIEVVAVVTAIGVLVATPARDVTTESFRSIDGLWWSLVLLLTVAVLSLAVVATFTSMTKRAGAIAEAEQTSNAMAAVSPEPQSTVAPSLLGPSEPRTARLGAPLVAMTTMFVLLGLALNTIGGTTDSVDGRSWTLGALEITSNDNSFITGWSTWNFSGLEAKPENLNAGGDVGQGGWAEYQYVQRTMAGVGEQVGCGRAMWEFAPELNRYGTTMAMMLLPMWTDGCIGSMEGLYFEATPTVPYHFMLQSDLSAPSRSSGADASVGGPSRAMRDLPYGDFDIDRGVDRMHELGVRYYLAFSPQSIQAAREHRALTEITSAAPWVIFETQATIVEALPVAPVVVDGVSDHQDEWLDVGIEWFDQLDAARPASSGPDAWRSVGAEEVVSRYEAENTRLAGTIALDDPALRDLLPVTDVAQETNVSNVVTDTDRISFSVDRIGTPILVRTSYFPSWKANGAEGPFRVAPNFMVVVPTQEDVEVVFARTAIDWSALVMTFLGLVGLGIVGRGIRLSPTPIHITPDADFGSGDSGSGESFTVDPTSAEPRADRWSADPDPNASQVV